MKPLLLFAVLLIGHSVFGQYKIVSNVKYEFDNLFNKQPKDVQAKRYIKGFDNGFALLLNFKEDTLNLNNFKPVAIDNPISLTPIDDNGNELPDLHKDKDTVQYNQWLSCQTTYLKDTLSISIFYRFLAGLSFSVKIIGDKSIGNLIEYSSSDNIFRNKLTDKKSTTIQVGAKPYNVILNEVPQKTGDTFYGKATLLTETFYQDDKKFKSGYIHKRYRITFLFTSKLTESEEKQRTTFGLLQ